MLQRLKSSKIDGELNPNLPERNIGVHHTESDRVEDKIYQIVFGIGMLNVAGVQEVSGRGFLTALTTIVRLRQICCDPLLLLNQLADDALTTTFSVSRRIAFTEGNKELSVELLHMLGADRVQKPPAKARVLSKVFKIPRDPKVEAKISRIFRNDRAS